MKYINISNQNQRTNLTCNLFILFLNGKKNRATEVVIVKKTFLLIYRLLHALQLSGREKEKENKCLCYYGAIRICFEIHRIFISRGVLQVSFLLKYIYKYGFFLKKKREHIYCTLKQLCKL